MSKKNKLNIIKLKDGNVVAVQKTGIARISEDGETIVENGAITRKELNQIVEEAIRQKAIGKHEVLTQTNSGYSIDYNEDGSVDIDCHHVRHEELLLGHRLLNRMAGARRKAKK